MMTTLLNLAHPHIISRETPRHSINLSIPPIINTLSLLHNANAIALPESQIALCLTLNTTAIQKSARIAAELRAEAPHVPVRPVLTRVDLELPNLDELRDRAYETFASWVEASQDDPW